MRRLRRQNKGAVATGQRCGSCPEVMAGTLNLGGCVPCMAVWASSRVLLRFWCSYHLSLGDCLVGRQLAGGHPGWKGRPACGGRCGVPVLKILGGGGTSLTSEDCE